MNTNEEKNKFNYLISDSTSKISSDLMEITSALTKSEDNSLKTKAENLFKYLLDYNRKISAEFNCLLNELNKVKDEIASVNEEKKKLEILFSAGIQFGSLTETKSLMSTALDIVIQELNADAGYIISINDKGDIEDIVSKNMKPTDEKDALSLSSTVIQNLINNSKPIQIQNTSEDDELSKRASIIRLGISSVLCVPLAAKSKVFGAVYLDRRKKEKSFSSEDLIFLLSFAKQIVRSFEVTKEISSLEKKLLNDNINNFEELRKEFKCENIVGNSRKLFNILKIASRLAATDVSCILLGENGTGKDLVANAIHQNSKRAGNPFIVINCGSIPNDLLESELFGYESGAFTGATKSKPGKIELAEGGTLFLDEIGEMNINLQAKLLRVIQTKEIERLGSVNSKKIDVRFIAATNRDIHKMIKEGKFREDLYYRLKVIEICMPPLRERKEDIQMLAEYFLKKHSDESRIFSIHDDTIEILESYNWPGNIRELENIILRCIVLSKNDIIEVSDLPEEIIQNTQEDANINLGKTLLDAETEFRRMYILKTLRKVKSKAEAAQLLGINRTHFYKLLSQLDIDL